MNLIYVAMIVLGIVLFITMALMVLSARWKKQSNTKRKTYLHAIEERVPIKNSAKVSLDDDLKSESYNNASRNC